MRRGLGGRAARALLAALTAVGITGCGGGSDNNATTATTVHIPRTVPPPPTTAALAKAACALLTRDDVAKALGNPVKEPQQNGDTDCSWATDVDGGTTAAITVGKPGTRAAPEACTAQLKTLPDGPPHEPVSGVGTSAVWVLDQLTTLRQGHLVACWSDSVVVVLLTGERDPAALRATAVNLANTVHGKL